MKTWSVRCSQHGWYAAQQHERPVLCPRCGDQLSTLERDPFIYAVSACLDGVLVGMLIGLAMFVFWAFVFPAALCVFAAGCHLKALDDLTKGTA